MTPRSLLYLLSLCLLVACDTNTPEEIPEEMPVPETGTLAVTVATEGAFPDQDGYAVELDLRKHNIGINDTLFIPALNPRIYTVDLQGIAPHCERTQATPMETRIVAGDTVGVQFEVLCHPVIRNEILFQRGEPGESGLYRMQPDGSDVQRLLPEEWDSWEPTIAQDGRTIAYTGPSEPRSFGIYAFHLGEEPVLVVEEASRPALAPDGKQIAFIKEAQLVVTNQDGTDPIHLTRYFFQADYPSWSPDGKQIAFSGRREETDNREIFVAEVYGSGLQQVTQTGEQVSNTGPSWSPDGTTLAYVSYNLNGVAGINTVQSDQSLPRLLVEIDFIAFWSSVSWSPDGEAILFQGSPYTGNLAGLWSFDLPTSTMTRLSSQENDAEAIWTPIQ